MIEVTFRIESLDYTDKLDSQLPLVLEALSQSGNINPVLKLACNTPEASSRIVKGILRTMSGSEAASGHEDRQRQPREAHAQAQ